jgi:Mg/Co/Ni transporter MgtE
MISKYSLQDLNLDTVQDHKAGSKTMNNLKYGAKTPSLQNYSGIDVDEIDRMLDKYNEFTFKQQDDNELYDDVYPEKKLAPKEDEIEMINKKYLQNLTDRSEIDKSRALIDELRSNLRKQTLEGMKKSSQK